MALSLVGSEGTGSEPERNGQEVSWGVGAEGVWELKNDACGIERDVRLGGGTD